MTESRPAKVSSIPADLDFGQELVRELLKRYSNPSDLTRVLLLLPTRRACRTVQEAFLRETQGKPLLLPRLMPLGDLDAEELQIAGEAEFGFGQGALDLPPALPPMKAKLLLARAVAARTIAAQTRSQAGHQDISGEQTALLAQELLRLIEQVETEGLSFEKLEKLVPEELASHWQETLTFLSIITETWPSIEAEQSAVTQAHRRRLLHEMQTQLWTSTPPDFPVIAAGSTGSIPSTAALLKVVANLPEGEVVLPGLDRQASDRDWREILGDPSHPQYGLAQLLKAMELERSEVVDWSSSPRDPQLARRVQIINAALAPAASTHLWQDRRESFADEEVEAAFQTLRLLEAETAGQEAITIALLLRETLEEPEKRAALVTSDRRLARRVASELRRWGIEVDDSAGQPLAQTELGQFLRLSARMVERAFAPVELLACLKNEFATLGLTPSDFSAKLSLLERHLLRGPRPSPGLEGLFAVVTSKVETKSLSSEGEQEIQGFLSLLQSRCEAFAEALKSGSLSEAVEAHLEMIEALAKPAPQGEGEMTGAERLWRGDAGEAAATFFADLRQAVDGSGADRDLPASLYPEILEVFLKSLAVRPRYGRHPRLFILGPLEARLQRMDRMVLSGLNEGNWPSESDPGPWMSRPMRAKFGLPPVERRIGLSAHDFVQACGAKEVYLTRALRQEGAPSVASRWIKRLSAFLSSRGQSDLLGEQESQWLSWAGTIDLPIAKVSPWPQPCPTPPLEARPKCLSVTRIETWMRDPYALYASFILKLRKLDGLDAEPSAADRGTITHSILERFCEAYPKDLPEDPEAVLTALAKEEFEPLRAFPSLHAFWLPRFFKITKWVAQMERERRGLILEVFVEKKGRLLVGDFELTARADRIEERRDGSMTVLDYKTGQLPKKSAVELGFAPQLTLEAAMIERGAFEGLPGKPVSQLLYWRLSGGDPAGEEREARGKFKPKAIDDLILEALEGLTALVEAYGDPKTGYPAQPRPAWALTHNDYAHLARIKEWSAGTTAEET